MPHLLGSEVLYNPTVVDASNWHNWRGQLAVGIDSMVNNFLAALTGRDSVPKASMLIAYISIAQGGLGLMDASSCAVPDMIITMSAAIRYAECGFTFGKCTACLHLSAIFSAAV